jgi:molecular chaperone DnaK (HSP70)
MYECETVHACRGCSGRDGEPQKSSAAIGIGVGSSTLRISYCSNATVRMLKNKEGEGVTFRGDLLYDASAGVRLLQKVKRHCVTLLQQTFDRAIIAVPAHFTSTQRNNISINATAAGFAFVTIIDNAIAATLTYSCHLTVAPFGHFLVFTLDESSCSAALVRKSAAWDVVNTEVDAHLTSGHFDDVVDRYVWSIVLHDRSRACFGSVRRKCEAAKRMLSTVATTTIVIDDFADDVYEIPLSRKKFEALADVLFERALGVVDRCVKKSGMGREAVEHVVLVGAATRTPKIEKMLAGYFNRSISRFVDPEGCVAYGAALFAAADMGVAK